MVIMSGMQWHGREDQPELSDTDAPSPQSGEQPPDPCSPTEPSRDKDGDAQQEIHE
jgi:hypothetical protein